MRLPAGHFRHEDVEQGPRGVLLAAYAWIARRASHDPSLLPAPLVLQDRALPHHARRPGMSRPAQRCETANAARPGASGGRRERGRAASRPHPAPRPPGHEQGRHDRLAARRVAQHGRCRVGERPAPPMGHDAEPLGGPGRPVVQVHPPAGEVAATALRLQQVIVSAPVAQVVTAADVAADLLTGRRGGPLDCRPAPGR
jgi:hypothetical protein